ncbi:alpha-L-fucosidase [Microbacterium kyungheense]|uniref:alpha-L-fucosidase n=1 Tax=Microbacterium kyungheense TaxID=1263636 RepID=A0A543EAW4_9MICO|nr:alpha-L-fucosidase [Microbacterium kyungheense]TQM18722.1 alpha-L-fucosidase [Microbacterium kyungheense]
MDHDVKTRPEGYERFERPVPDWFRDAKLGIFVHWGAYSVPAWAEPIGALGTIDDTRWYRHNPYAEWYANTIRIEGSPAAEHHRTTYRGRPYDDFLDDWKAEAFDADALVALFAEAGARYVVPTTKHHDGIALWDAPHTGGRNTVARGARRDLVGEFAAATRAAGLRFGAYYSGGLDWHAAPAAPIESDEQLVVPTSAEYAQYAHDHVVDLIDRYRPDLLWGDIGWPTAGHAPGPFSLADVFDRFYAAAPDGVVNDRWGGVHADYLTSEYEAHRSSESAEVWENCRGIGYSFGYNRLEGPEHNLDGPAAVRLFVDVVSRGGNLLLNVGPTASGTLPEPQAATLRALGAWNARHGDAVFGSRPLAGALASDDPWVRWTRTGARANAIIDASGRVEIAAPDGVDAATAVTVDGEPVWAERRGGVLVIDVPAESAGPAVVGFAAS